MLTRGRIPEKIMLLVMSNNDLDAVLWDGGLGGGGNWSIDPSFPNGYELKSGVIDVYPSKPFVLPLDGMR